MKKILATAATFSLMSLSLAFLACGDDSSSSYAGPSSGEPGEKVVASIEECNLGSDLVGQEKAYLQGNESEGYRLVIPDMHVNNEWHGDELSVKRNGDTLLVEQEGTLVSLNWVCYSDHWFDIPAADADIKYFKLYNQVFEVVSGPIPERKRITIIVDNSSSSIVPESSSNMPPSSSSSVTPPSSSSRPSYNGPVPLKTISATCRERVMTTNPVEPEPPRAYLGISNSFAEIKLFNVDLSYACDSALQKVFWDSLNAGNTVASVIGDTLFVNFKRSDEKGVEYKCGCKADVEFTFDEQYRSFGYTAFENNRPPLELQYILVNRPNLGYQKIEKADAQCNKSGPDDPMVDAALPPVAHMYVNGDSAQIVIEEVVLTCGTIFESVAIEMKDSTLYVTPHYDTSLPQADCLCTSKVSFNIKALDLYKEATLLVYDDGTSFNLSNKMRLIVE